MEFPGVFSWFSPTLQLMLTGAGSSEAFSFGLSCISHDLPDFPVDQTKSFIEKSVAYLQCCFWLKYCWPARGVLRLESGLRSLSPEFSFIAAG